MIKQHPEESASYSERVRDLQRSIERSLTSGVRGAAGDPNAKETRIWAMPFFVAGLLPKTQELVRFKAPTTFDEALALALRKELSLKCIVQPSTITGAESFSCPL